MRKLLFALLLGLVALPCLHFLSETSPLVAQSPISPLPTATPYLLGPPLAYYTPGWHDPVTPVSPLPTSPPSPIATLTPSPTGTTSVTVTSFEAKSVVDWDAIAGTVVMSGIVVLIVVEILRLGGAK